MWVNIKYKLSDWRKKVLNCYFSVSAVGMTYWSLSKVFFWDIQIGFQIFVTFVVVSKTFSVYDMSCWYLYVKNSKISLRSLEIYCDSRVYAREKPEISSVTLTCVPYTETTLSQRLCHRGHPNRGKLRKLL